MANGNGNNWPRWTGIIVAILAFAVQWGVVTTKLEHVGKRLDEFIVEARALRTEYQTLAQRVAMIEGRQNGRQGS